MEVIQNIISNSLPALVLLLLCCIGLGVGVLLKGKSIKGTCASALLVIEGEKEACNTCPMKTNSLDD